jgi:hypothetical protein
MSNILFWYCFETATSIRVITLAFAATPWGSMPLLLNFYATSLTSFDSVNTFRFNPPLELFPLTCDLLSTEIDIQFIAQAPFNPDLSWYAIKMGDIFVFSINPDGTPFVNLFSSLTVDVIEAAGLAFSPIDCPGFEIPEEWRLALEQSGLL